MWFDHTAKFEYLSGEETVQLTVPSAYIAQRIRQGYFEQLSSVVHDELGPAASVELHVDDLGFTPPTASQDAAAEQSNVAVPCVPRERSVPTGLARDTQTSSREAGYPLASGTLRHRLDQFVVGPSNRLAFAAAQRMASAIADDPSNPFGTTVMPVLFLHGGCGLGKTHLLQGICKATLQRDPGARILYTTGEQFTNRFIQAVRTNSLPAFRRRMRNLDLLAVDDVHFIAAKDKTQQEFLHCFNEIELGGARVVLASDSHPKLIHSFPDALVNRCMRGMVVQVTEPDAETRRTLIRTLAMRKGMVLHPQALERLASRNVDSVREIEGCLTKLHALASLERGRLTGRPAGLTGMPATLSAPIGHALVDRLLAEQSAVRPVRPVRFDRLMDTVCEYMLVDREQLLGRGRHKHVVLARAVLIHLLRKLTPMSYPEIALKMGKKNHSGVITAAQRFAEQLKADEPLTVPARDGTISPGQLVSELKELAVQ